ncbi:S1C family serine protease [Cellulomonas rhizosphaerae]|uniref:Serine protease n=1 Tax=Cellulomonas rhizosphaerae TaxID=2293719 RepID=A0A413RKA4_9CELL|nr:serine protease [Cellulomonas rhizosphaerae]RHA39530.1 serine protease [Cellulomonas rhizosphaerae]
MDEQSEPTKPTDEATVGRPSPAEGAAALWSDDSFVPEGGMLAPLLASSPLPYVPEAASIPPDEPRELVLAGASSSSGRGRLQRGAAFGAALVVGAAFGAGGVAALDRPSSSTSSASSDPVAPAFTPADVQQQAPTWPGVSTVSASGVVTVTALTEDASGQVSAAAAGTAMILTSDGVALTNNHVIEGASAIQVTDPSSGQSWTATVVATDARADVAVLQLADASDLATVTLDDDSGAAVGDDVTAVGNAEGEGSLVAASGSVVALEQTVTTSTESVSGLLAFSSPVVEGDSGGPVFDDEGEVVGMTTAMATDGRYTVAYAIAISDALVVARQLDPSLSAGAAV